MLNINGSTDPSYRYKMPRIMGKVEGRGNGIKTVIVNSQSVADSLKRPTTQFVKFLGLQMGAQSRIEGEKAIVNGAFDSADLQKQVFAYIDKFVLCPECKNPETVQILQGKKRDAALFLECKACGKISQADNSHKLTTHILRDLEASAPKDEKKRPKAAEGAGAEAIEEATKAAEDSNAAIAAAGGVEVDDDDGSGKKKKKKSKDEDGDEDKKKKKKKKKSESEKGDGDEEKKKKKKKKKSESEKGDGEDKKKKKKKKKSKDEVGDDLAGDFRRKARMVDDVAYNAMFEKIQPLFTSTLEDGSSVVELVASELALAGLPKTDLFHLVFTATVKGTKLNVRAAIEKYAKLFSSVLERIGLDQSPAVVMGMAEETIVQAKGDEATLERAVKMFPVAVKALYDAGLLNEATIMEWHKKDSLFEVIPSSGSHGLTDDTIRTRAKRSTDPLIEWLADDDEEDDDDEDDDDDDDDSPAAKMAPKKTAMDDTETESSESEDE